MLYSVAPNSGKARNTNTTWLRAMSCEWIYAQAPVRSGKMADRCDNTAATQILYLREEAVLRKKKPRFKSTDCRAEAISVGLPGRFVTVWKNQTGHTHTHTYTATVTLRRMCTAGLIRRFLMYVYMHTKYSMGITSSIFCTPITSFQSTQW